MDGLDVIKRLQSRDREKSPVRPSVIFITAYDDYVFEALDLFPFHLSAEALWMRKIRKGPEACSRKIYETGKEEAILFHTKIIICAFIPVDIYFVESNLRKSHYQYGKMSILKFITRWRSWKAPGSLFPLS